MAQQNYGGLGLLAGLSRGLMAGLDSFRTERKRQDDLAAQAADHSYRDHKLIDDRKQSETSTRLSALKEGYKYNPDAAEPVGLFTRDEGFIKERNDENARKAREALQKADTDFTQSTGRVPVRDAQGNIIGTKKLFDKPVSTLGTQKTFESDIQKLAKETASAQSVNSALANVDSALGFPLDAAEVRDGKLFVNGQEKDLPGVSVPLVGRVSGFSGDARSLQTAVARVFNVELKDRSGAAVTTPELERLKTEFASGRLNTEAEMIRALQQYKAEANRALASREAGFRPEVVAEYQRRGGTTSKSFSKSKDQAPKLSDDDQAALDWANKNPNDKRAAEIKRRLGM